MGSIYIDHKIGTLDEAQVLAKWREHTEQAKALERKITEHENSVLECRRQISEIRKAAEPYRAALVRVLGGDS